MGRGQTTLEFLMIMGVALLILLVTITISNEQGSAMSTRKAELQASLAASDIGNAAREVYAQGIGARKLSLVTLPRSYNASQSGVYPYYLKIRAGRTDYIETFPFPVTGSLPGRPGTFEFLVENDGGTVSIGRWLAYANTSAVDASIYGGESYYESISLSSLSSTDANVTVNCTWEEGPVAIECQNASFALAAHASVPFLVGFSASEAAFGVHSGTVNVTVQGALGNQSIEIPVSVSVIEVYGELSSKIAFLAPTPAKASSITLAQLGVSPVVVNASVSNIALSSLRYTFANKEYGYYDDSLVAMYNFDENPALGESAGTVADASKYGNNASVYDSVRLMMHMDEADGNTSFDGSAYHNDGTVFGNTRLLLHMDENTGGTAFDESAYKNNGTCVGMTPVNGANACSWVAGKNGSGISFDGVDDFVDLGNAISLNITNSILTLETWVNLRKTAGNNYIVSKQGSGGFGLEVADGLLNFVTPGSGNHYSSVIVSTDAWHHVTVVVTGTSALFYLDGVFDRSTALVGSISGNANRVFLGQRENVGGFLNGTLDEVGIYSTALSADEVYAQYNATRAKHADWVAGRSGTGLEFDGVDDYAPVAASPSLNLNGSVSLSAWIKASVGSSSNYRMIISKEESASVDPYRMYLQTGSSVLVFGSICGGAMGTSALNDGLWHHVVGTRDDSAKVASIYIDGVLHAQSAYSSSCSNPQAASGTPTWVGKAIYGNRFPFNGSIDEVAVYDRALSPSEVFEQFSTGRATHSESVPGVYGRALEFDGVDDYVDLGDVSFFDGTAKPATFSAWVKPTGGSSGAIISKSSSLADRYTFGFRYSSTGKLTFQLQGPTVNTNYWNFATGESVIPPNSWSHVTAVVTSFSPQNIDLYVNGVEVASTLSSGGTPPTSWPDNAVTLKVGKEDFAAAPYAFNGSIDEVRVWSRALSAAEIRQQYYSNLAKVSPDSWLFTSAHPQLDSKRYDYALFARDSNGQYDRASRNLFVTYNTIGFVASTPSSGSSASSASLLYDPFVVNASIANASLSAMNFSWGGQNVSFFDSSLVLAYNFDDTIDVTNALGGTITYSGDYVIHTFTANGTFNVTGSKTVEYLVVGGGGAGGWNWTTGGGGGGGGVLNGTGLVVSGLVNVVVGAGGVAATQTSGEPSSLANNGVTITAIGGGSGGWGSGKAGLNGGSGGGGGNRGAGGVGVVGQGNSGGIGNGDPYYNAGGGGGASQIGASASARSAGKGGDGVSSSISGVPIVYGGGGGGGADFCCGRSGVPGAGGTGGGGAGAQNNAVAASGTNGLGGGGGGGSQTSSGTRVTDGSGAGGSGIVIVRYLRRKAIDNSIYANDGACSGATCPSAVEGKYGRALYFDGFEDYLSVTNNEVLNSTTSQFSLSYWVKPSAISDAGLVTKHGQINDVQVLIVAGGGGGANGLSGHWGGGGGGAGGVLQGVLPGVSGSYAVVVGSGGLHAGGYGGSGGNSSFGNYLAYGGGGGGSWYYPGRSGGSSGGTGNGNGSTEAVLQTSQFPLTGYGNAGTYFGGGGAAGVGGTYAGGAGLYSTISGTNTYYAPGGSLQTPAVYYGGGGMQGLNGDFIGGDGKQGIVIIRYPASYGNATGGAITTVVDGGVTYRVHTFTSSGTFSTNGTSGWATGLEPSGKVSFKLGLNTTGYASIESATALSPDDWYFITSTWNGTTMSIYVNGVLESTQPAAGVLNGTSDVVIGRDASSSADYFDGSIDEVRVWDRALSSSEVAQHYVSSLNKYAPGKWMFLYNRTLAAGSYSYEGYARDAVGWNSTGTRAYSSVYNRIGFIAPTPAGGLGVNLTEASSVGMAINASLSGTNLSQLTLELNGTNYTAYDSSLVLAYNFDNNSAVGDTDERVTDLSRYGNTGAVSSNALTLHFDDNDGFIAQDSGPNRLNGTIYGNTLMLLHMDENNGTTAYDAGIYRHNGTISGAAWAAGKSGSGLSFDGVNDYVETYDYSWNTSNSFSMSVWFNTKNASQDQVLISKASYEYSLRIDGQSLGLYFVYWTSAGADNLGLHFGNVSSNSWNHVVVSYDAATRTGRGYLNGQLADTSTLWSVDFLNRALPTRIGYGYHLGGASYSFNGSIDEVGIYNRSLSADEALAQYNEGKAKFAEWDSDGKSGTAMRFDGINDYVELGTDSRLNQLNNIFSISAWVKTGDSGNWQWIYQFGQHSDHKDRSLVINDGNKATMYTYYGDAVGTTTVTDNEWHHLVGTSDGTTTRIYVDGVLEKSATPTFSSFTYSGARIGINNPGGYYPFNGSIDEVAVYNTALSATDVSQMYNDGKPKHLNYVDGKYGKSVQFDGTGDYVDFSSKASSIGGQVGTLQLWFKKSYSGRQYVFGAGDTVASWSGLLVGPTTDSYADESLAYLISSGGSYPLQAFVRHGESYFSDGLWHQVVLVMGSNYNKIFIDGAEEPLTYGAGSAATGGYFFNPSGLDSMAVGRRFYPDYPDYFNGSIDEVRIWNRTLSAAEVAQGYYSSLAKYAPDKWLFSTTAFADAAGGYSFNAYLRDADGAWNSTGARTVSVTNSTSISFLPPTPVTGSNVYSGAYPVAAAVANQPNISSFYLFAGKAAYPVYDDSLVLAYNFDNVASIGESAAKAVDVSRYGNNGTVYGNANWTTNGKYGGAMGFDGVNDYVEVSTSSSLRSITNDFTMSAWFKRFGVSGGTSDAGYHGIIRGGTSWAPRILVTSDGGYVLLEECLNGTTTPWHALGTSSVPFNIGEWHQIVVRKGAYGTEMYIDGSLSAYNRSMYGTTTASASSFFIGTGATPLLHYMANGLIDEVRVWNRSLSAGEISQHYYSNLNKYAPDKWFFQANVSGVHPGVEDLRVMVRDSSNSTFVDKRSFNVISSQAAFSDPTPSGKRLTSSIAAMPFYPMAVNASITNISLSNLSFQWGASNYSLYDDSLVLAYNFDNAEAIGDSARQVTDLSRYGNNGTVYGNTMLLLHMDEAVGNVAYDEGAYRNNATCYNMGGITGVSACNWAAGKSGSAISFDGSNDYVLGATSQLNVADAVALEGWLYMVGSNQARFFGSFQAAGSANPQYAFFGAPNYLRIQLKDASNSWDTALDVNYQMNLQGAWHHIVFSFGKPNYCFYVDGLAVKCGAWYQSIRSDANPAFYLGARGDLYASELFNGTMDEVAAYNRSLSAAEVLDHYYAGRAKHADYTTDGKYGGALKFDGKDDFISAGNPASLQFQREITITAWVKHADSQRGYIIDKYGSSNHGPMFSIESNGGLNFYSYNSTVGHAFGGPSTNLSVPVNEWHFVAVSANVTGGYYDFYADGNTQRLTSYTDVLWGTSGNLFIGVRNKASDTSYFNGSIDEVRIWNRSLSADEIKLQYYSNLAKYAPDKWLFSYNVPTDLAPANYDYAVYANDYLADASWGAYSGRKRITATQDRISFIGQTPATISTFSAGTAAFDPVQINASIGNVSLSSAKLNWNGVNSTLFDSSLVLMYNFDNVLSVGDNATRAVDLSAYGNNGTIVGVPWTQSGKFGGALDFGGLNDYVYAPDSVSLNPTAALTVSAWVNPDSLPSLSNGVELLGKTGQYELLANRTGVIFTDRNASVYVPTALVAGEWHQVAGVIAANASMSLYVDGILKGSVPFGSMQQSANAFMVGSAAYVPAYSGSAPTVYSATCTSSNLYGQEPNCPADDTANAQLALTHDFINTTFRAASLGSKTYTHILDYGSAYAMDKLVWDGYTPSSSYCCGTGCAGCHNDNYFYLYGSTDLTSWFSIGGGCGKLPCADSSFGAKPVRYLQVVVTSSCNGCSNYDYVDSWALSSASSTENVVCGSASSKWTCPATHACGSVAGACNVLFNGRMEDFDGRIDEVRIWNRSLSSDEVYVQYSSNLAKYAPNRWQLSANRSVSAVGGYPFYGYANESLAGSFTPARTLQATNNRIGFVLPTPADGAAVAAGAAFANGIAINASAVNANLSSFKFNWNGTNTSYYDDSLVLAYNFDDALAAGDTNERVMDYSRYGNNGAAFGNVLTLHFDEENGSFALDSSASRNNGVIYGDTAGLWHFDEADGNTAYDDTRFASNGTVYGNTRLLLHMDEGAGNKTYDESAYKNNATCYNMLGGSGITNCNWSSGKSGMGMGFDGVNDYVLVNASDSMNPTSALSAEAWVYPMNVSGAHRIFSKTESGGYTLLITNGALYLSVMIGGSYYVAYCPTISANQWHHVVGTYNGANLACYLDGVSGTPVVQSGSITSSAQALAIGAEPNGIPVSSTTDLFEGTIDEFAIYSSAFGASEILDHYAAGKAKHSDWVAGKSGTGMQFDGINDYLSLGSLSHIVGSSAITAEAWIYPRTVTPVYQEVLVKGLNDILIRVDTGGKVVVTVNNVGVATTAGIIIPNQWQHVAYSWNTADDLVRIYVNGVLVKTGVASANTISNTGNAYLGAWYGLNGEWFNGSIDEVAIYNRSLSASEVAEHYAAGRASHLERGAGRKGNGLQFDGVDDYFAGSANGINGTKRWAATGWFRTVGTGELMVLDTRAGIRTGIFFMQASNDVWRLFLASPSAAIKDYTYALNLNDGNWHNYAITRDGDNSLSLYVDGAYATPTIQTNADMTGISETWSTFTLGAFNQHNYYFWNGSIDEVALYNRSLSAAEVLQMYEEGVPKHLNYVDGKYGKAVQFDGVSDYVDAGNSASLDITSAITIAMWVQPNQLAAHRLFGKINGYTTHIFRNKFEMVIIDGGVARLQNRDASGGVDLSVDTWYYLVATYDGSQMKTYVNGVLDRSGAYSGDMDSGTSRLIIGNALDSPGIATNGTIDEVRVWNRSLTASEIQQQYYSNLAKYSADRWLFSSVQPIRTVGNYTYFAYLRDLAGSGNITEKRVVSVASGNPVSFAPPTPADGAMVSGDTVPVRAVVSNVSQLDQFRLLSNNRAYSFYDDSLVLAYNFDNVASIGENATRAVDVSKYGNNGTISGASWTGGKYGGALAFDFVDDKIVVSNEGSFDWDRTQPFSIQAWVKTSSTESAMGLVNKGLLWGPGWDFNIMSNPGFSGNARFYICDSASHCPGVITNKTLNDGQWHQITATYDGSSILPGLSLYLDGQVSRIDVQSGTLSSSMLNNYSINIGFTPGWTKYFNGSIDEVRIWNRSLSADEIKQQYYSNFAKFAPDKWLFQSNQTGLTTGAMSYWAIARDTQNNLYVGKRVANVQYNAISFASPTPQKRLYFGIGAGAVEPFAINASINASLSSAVLSLNGTNHSFYNDSLVLAYNFDDVAGIGDSAGKVVDVSKYGNNGTVYGNTRLLLHMDEGTGNVTYDESRLGNNGTCYNMGGATGVSSCNWVSGKSGRGISFEGVNDYVDVGTAVNPVNNKLSAELWVYYLGGTEPRQFLISKYNGASWYIEIVNGYARFVTYGLISGAWTTVISNSVQITPRTWYHIVGVWDKPTQYFYVNGVQQTPQSADFDSLSNGNMLALGRDGPNDRFYLNGTIDEVGVYGKALSADEVLSHYNAGKAKHADWVQDGKWGSAMSFDGVDDYVSVGNGASLNITSAITISAWARRSEIGRSQSIVRKGGQSNTILDYNLGFGLADNLGFGASKTTGEIVGVASIAVYTSTTSWYHVVGSFDGSNYKTYVNGVEVANSGVTNSNTNVNVFYIGQKSDGTQRFNGAIDEVRVWNRSLSAEEIRQHYYGSLNKYAPDKWLFTSVQDGPSTTAGSYNYSLYATDANGVTSFSGARAAFVDHNHIGFVQPSPAYAGTVNYAQAVASPITINASISGIATPSEMAFNWNGTGATYMNDSLVLAYNFDDVAGIGDSAAKVVDTSKYGNNGTVYGNTIALLHMDENTGNTTFDEGRFSNNGTCYNMGGGSGVTNCNWVAGKAGTGIRFDGVNDYVSMASSLPVLNDFTIEFWFTKLNTARGHAFSSGSSGANNLMCDFDDGGYGVWVYWMGGGNPSVRTTTTYNDGYWHHLLVTRSGSAVTLYMDGVSKATTDSSITITASSIHLGDNFGNNLWNGSIDELVIANRSYSASEVLSRYNAGRARHADWDPNGKWNSAMRFDGLNDYIVIPSPSGGALNPLDAITLEAWAYWTATPVSGYLISKGWGDVYDLVISNSRAAFAVIHDASVSSSKSVSSPSPLFAGAWHHVAGTYDKNTVSLYVDGQLVSSGYFNESMRQTGYYSVKIGANWHTGEAGLPLSYYQSFNGSIDEVRIWNRSLTASEISQHYYSSLNKYAPDRWLFQSTPPANATGSYSYYASVRDAAGVLNTTEARTFSVGVQDWISFISPTPADGSNARFGNITINASIANVSLSKMVFSWNGTNYTYLDNSLVLAMNFDDASAAGDTAGRATDYSNYGNNGTINGNTLLLLHMDEGDNKTVYDESRFANNGMVYGNTLALYHFDENSGTKAYDESAYKNNATCWYYSSLGCNWTVGKSGSGMYFDGNNYLYLGNPASLNLSRAFTVSTWLKLEDTDVARSIFYKGYLWSSYHGINLRRGSSNRFNLMVGNGATISVIESNSNATTNRWYHVAGVYDGTTFSLYVDGVKQAQTANVAAPIAYEANSGVQIGAGGVNQFLGTMDEFGIYNRSLSSSEILDHYNAGKAKHADWVAGKSGTGLQFDGVDDYVNLGTTVMTTNATTISMWIKSAAASQLKGLGSFFAGGTGVIVYQGSSGGVTDAAMFGFRGAPEIRTSANAIVPGQWQYLTFMYTGGTKTDLASYRIYINGVPQAITALGTIGSTQTAARIGSDQTGVYWNGTIDEVMIANRSLSQAEVLEQYNAGKAKHANWDPAGKWGSAMKFDGVDDYVAVNDSDVLDFTSAVTVSTWVRPNAWTDWAQLVDKDGNFLLRADGANPTSLQWVWYNGTVVRRCLSPSLPPLGVWTNVVVTAAGNDVNAIYFNGVSQGCTPSTWFAGGRTMIYNLSIGGNNLGFNGSIDEVRVWNRALSADEIRQNYYSNLAKVSPDRWVFTSNQTFGPTGGTAIPYSIWVRDANTWNTDQTGRIVTRE